MQLKTVFMATMQLYTLHVALEYREHIILQCGIWEYDMVIEILE